MLRLKLWLSVHYMYLQSLLPQNLKYLSLVTFTFCDSASASHILSKKRVVQCKTWSGGHTNGRAYKQPHNTRITAVHCIASYQARQSFLWKNIMDFRLVLDCHMHKNYLKIGCKKKMNPLFPSPCYITKQFWHFCKRQQEILSPMFSFPA